MGVTTTSPVQLSFDVLEPLSVGCFDKINSSASLLPYWGLVIVFPFMQFVGPQGLKISAFRNEHRKFGSQLVMIIFEIDLVVICFRRSSLLYLQRARANAGFYGNNRVRISNVMIDNRHTYENSHILAWFAKAIVLVRPDCEEPSTND